MQNDSNQLTYSQAPSLPLSLRRSGLLIATLVMIGVPYSAFAFLAGKSKSDENPKVEKKKDPKPASGLLGVGLQITGGMGRDYVSKKSQFGASADFRGKSIWMTGKAPSATAPDKDFYGLSQKEQFTINVSDGKLRSSGPTIDVLNSAPISITELRSLNIVGGYGAKTDKQPYSTYIYGLEYNRLISPSPQKSADVKKVEKGDKKQDKKEDKNEDERPPRGGFAQWSVYPGVVGQKSYQNGLSQDQTALTYRASYRIGYNFNVTKQQLRVIKGVLAQLAESMKPAGGSDSQSGLLSSASTLVNKQAKLEFNRNQVINSMQLLTKAVDGAMALTKSYSNGAQYAVDRAEAISDRPVWVQELTDQTRQIQKVTSAAVIAVDNVSKSAARLQAEADLYESMNEEKRSAFRSRYANIGLELKKIMESTLMELEKSLVIKIPPIQPQIVAFAQAEGVYGLSKKTIGDRYRAFYNVGVRLNLDNKDEDTAFITVQYGNGFLRADPTTRTSALYVGFGLKL